MVYCRTLPDLTFPVTENELNRVLGNVPYLRTYIYVVGRCVTKHRTYIYVLGRERIKLIN